MGVTKFDLFTARQNELARAARAFAHPARVAILEHIAKAKTCINSDLVQELGLAQATISQHLRELKDLGILQGTIAGPSVSYCIHPSSWEEIGDLFNDLFDRYQAPTATDCGHRVCNSSEHDDLK